MQIYDMTQPAYQQLQAEFTTSRQGCFAINTSAPDSPQQRTAMADLFQDALPADSTIWAPIKIDRIHHFHVGHHAFINHDLTTVALGGIYIGDNVQIAPGVTLLTANHDIAHMNILKTAPIRIEAGAWIGANATILPGVTVGTGAIVGAGAVVTKNVAPHTLVGGNPAKFIKAVAQTSHD